MKLIDFVDFPVDNMDNFVENSNFSSLQMDFKHIFFFINCSYNAYFLRHNPGNHCNISL
jgi:hypothetical protein